ncbi:unnamed protein product [Closterium sp. NIES-65]|nr:unnamed protein product [Closterium sp. NIES-65]
MDQHDYSVRGSASSQRVDEAASEAASSIAMRHLPADPATILRGVPFVPAGEQRLLPSLEIARSRLETSGGDLNLPPNPWNLPVGASAGVVVPFGAENTSTGSRVVPAAARPHLNPPRNEERSSVYRDLPGSAAELSLHGALPLSLAATTTAVGVGSPLQLAPRVTPPGAPPPLVLACGQDEQQRHSAAGARSSSREQTQEVPLIGFPSSLLHAMKAGVAPGHCENSPAAGRAAIGLRGGRQETGAGRTSAASVQWGSGLALSQPALPPAREIRFALLGEREAAGEEDRGAGKGSGAAGEVRGGGGGEGGGQKEELKGFFGLGQAEAPGAQGMAALAAYQRRDDPCSGAAAPLHSAFPQQPAAAASASAVAAGDGGATGAGDFRRTLRGSLGSEVPQEGSNCLGGAFLSLGFPGSSAQEPLLPPAEQQGKRVDEVGARGLSELLLRARSSREVSPTHARTPVEVGTSGSRAEGLQVGPREDVWLGLGAGLALQGGVGAKGGVGEGRVAVGGAVDSSAGIAICGAVGPSAGELAAAALTAGAVGSRYGEGGEVAQERHEEGRGAGSGRGGGASGRIWSGGEREGSVSGGSSGVTGRGDTGGSGRGEAGGWGKVGSGKAGRASSGGASAGPGRSMGGAAEGGSVGGGSSVRGGGGSSDPFICQVDSCDVELTSHKEYYRRHRVCEAHAKATHVHIQGKAQRFCQQCSRRTPHYPLHHPSLPSPLCLPCAAPSGSFHDLCEFDDSRRSCRRRLLGHNRRRRKQQHHPLMQGTPPPQQPLPQPLSQQQQQQQTSSSSNPFFPITRNTVEGKEVAAGITAAAAVAAAAVVAPHIPSFSQGVSLPTTPTAATATATATAKAAATERTSGPTAREPVLKPPFASLASLPSAAAVQAGSSGGGGDPLCGRPVRQFSAMSACDEAGESDSQRAAAVMTSEGPGRVGRTEEGRGSGGEGGGDRAGEGRGGGGEGGGEGGEGGEGGGREKRGGGGGERGMLVESQGHSRSWDIVDGKVSGANEIAEIGLGGGERRRGRGEADTGGREANMQQDEWLENQASAAKRLKTQPGVGEAAAGRGQGESSGANRGEEEREAHVVGGGDVPLGRPAVTLGGAEGSSACRGWSLELIGRRWGSEGRRWGQMVGGKLGGLQRSGKGEGGPSMDLQVPIKGNWKGGGAEQGTF